MDALQVVWELVFKRRVRENNNICPNCGAYFFLTARERLESLIDDGTFVDISKPIVADDPLGFSDTKPYPKRVEEAQEKTGLPSAIILGSATVTEIPVVIGVMEFQFIGGSMGSVMGSRSVTGWRRRSAAASRSSSSPRPAGRGCRRIFSLMQMAKVSTVRTRLAEEGIPFISIMTYPTTGGVLASIASLGDVIIAEKGATIRFAGRQVIRDTIAEELPENFQTDAFALAHGAIDRVVPREELKNELGRLLSLFVEAG